MKVTKRIVGKKTLAENLRKSKKFTAEQIEDVSKFGFLGKVIQTPPTPANNRIIAPILDAELAVDETAIYKRLKLVPYTPDLLINRRGFQVLNTMLDDPEIEGCVDTLQTIRLSSGWEIIAGEETGQGIAQRDFIEHCFETVDGSFDDDLREIMNAIPIGWSLNELVLHQIETGEFAGKIGLKAIKSKNIKYFNLYTDDFDNLRPNGVVNISSFDYGRAYPTEKFVVYSWQKRYENIFGRSKIRALYDMYFLKQVFIRAYGIFTEKYGHPIPIIKHAQGLDATSRQALLNILKQFRIETGLLLPDTVELELKEAMNNGGSNNPYTAGLEWFNSQITKKILGQTLTRDSSSKGTGSYSLGQVHFDILLMFEEQLGTDVADKAVNPQIIKRLIDMNWRNTTHYPEFKFKPLMQEDKEKIIDKYLLALQAGAIKSIPEDEKQFREWFHLPYRNTDVAPAPVAPQSPISKPDIPTPTASELPEFDYSEFAENIFTGVKRRAFTKYEESVDFVEIEQALESEVYDGSNRVAKIIQDGVKDMIDEISKKKIMQDKNFTAIDLLQLKYVGDMKTAFADSLTNGFKSGMKGARKELTTKKKALKFRDYRTFAQVDIRNVTPKQAVEYLKQKAYHMAGIEKANIEKKVKQILLDGLKTGSGLKDVISAIDNALEEYVAKEGKGAIEIPDDLLGSRLETIVRTNYADALNQGRDAFFNDPALDGYVTAFQYTAIMDDRVRPNHAAGDGLVFSVNNSIWDSLTPPNGFNCRCMKVPVTEDDTWEEDEQPAGFFADKGFGKPGAE